MKQLIQKTLKSIGRISLWGLSVLLLLVIVVQLALWAGILWLNTDKGTQWAQNKINTSIKDSAYSVEVEGFQYRPLTAIKIAQLNILDKDGTFAKATNIRVAVDIISLPMKELSFSLRGDTVSLIRTPQSKERAVQDEGAVAFTMPDLYFNKISLSDISIQSLEISESIAGQKINLSPKLTGAIAFNKESAAMILRLSPDTKKITGLKNIPDRLILNAKYDTLQNKISLRYLKADAALYSAEVKGNIVLSKGNAIDITGTLKSDNLSSLRSGLKGDLVSTFQLSGTKNNLKVQSNGTLNLDQFKKNNIAPISFKIVSNLSPQTGLKDLKATADIRTAYKELPVTLIADFIENEGNILIENIAGNAPDIAVKGRLKIDPKTMLIEGTLSSVIKDLNQYQALLNQDINAAGNITVSLLQNNSLQEMITTSDLSRISYDNILMSGVTIKTHTNDIKNYKATALDLNLQKLNAGALSLSNMTASLKEENDGYSFAIKTNGRYENNFSLQATSTLINLTSAEVLPTAKEINAAIKMGSSAVIITGQADSQNIDLDIETKNLVLDQLPITLPYTMKDITLSATASIKGLMNSPVVKAQMNLNPLTVSQNAPKVQLTVDSQYKDNMAAVSFVGKGTGIQELTGNIQTPVKLSLNPFQFEISDNQAMNGALDIRILAGDVIDQLLPPDYDLSGAMAANITIGGTFKDPIFSGKGALSNGYFSDDGLGVTLKDINMTTLFSNDKIILENLNANDNNQGKLNASGQVSIDNYAIDAVDLSLRLKDFRLLKSDIADGVFSADINVLGSPDQYDVKGIIKSDYIDITIPEKHNQSIPKLNIVAKEDLENTSNKRSKIILDLQYIADNRIFVRGWGLDAEFGGKVAVTGNLNNPQFTGQLQSSRGRYEEFGKRFKLAKANLNFLGTIPPTPSLDITAETRADDIMARVNLTGSIADPKIGFSSTPSLPEDEVLSRILFGRDLSTISPFQAVQLTQTLRRFSGKGGGFDPLAAIRDATGVDDLRVETDEEGQANIGVGKYLTDKVYLEFEKGAGENSGAANVEIEVTPNITVESEIGQDSESGAGVFWQWDY